MNQEHGQGQKGETLGIRGSEGGQSIYPHTDSSEALSGASRGVGVQLLTLDRENSATGVGNYNPFGGILDQLLDDAKKQLIKSNECIVWYREEAKEYEEKVNNLMKLKELQEQQWQQMQRQQEVLLEQQQIMQRQLMQQQTDSYNPNIRE